MIVKQILDPARAGFLFSHRRAGMPAGLPTGDRPATISGVPPFGRTGSEPPALPQTTAYRILALDVDGTLLDRSGTLRPRTVAAVALAAGAGMRPVLCTGRRYRRALPIAEQLGLDAPLVCNSGALVKDPRGHRTLWRADFDAGRLAEVLAVFRARGELALSFTDRPPDGPDF